MLEPRSDAFFRYLDAREEVRLRKEADFLELEQGGVPQGPPWTDDPILSNYKFTNVFRHHDRTSSGFREILYGPNFNADPVEILMNCAIARYFGTVEFLTAAQWGTIEHMEDHLEDLKALAKYRSSKGKRVFTGAYVITNSGISAPKEDVVVDFYLKPLLESAPQIVKIATDSQSWERMAYHMMQLMGFGGTGFMTKEVLIDLTYTGFWADRKKTKDGSFSFPVDWWDWTPVGPGARRGAWRVRDLGELPKKPSESIGRSVIKHLIADQVSYPFQSVTDWLSPTDIQFGLCEFDKYERARLGEGRPKSKYKWKGYL